MRKKLLVLCLGLMIFLSSCSNGTELGLVGKWHISDLYVEPQARWSYSHNSAVKQIANAFPEIDATVEFTRLKYDDGYKLISSNVVSYSIMSDNRRGHLPLKK